MTARMAMPTATWHWHPGKPQPTFGTIPLEWFPYPDTQVSQYPANAYEPNNIMTNQYFEFWWHYWHWHPGKPQHTFGTIPMSRCSSIPISQYPANACHNIPIWTEQYHEKSILWILMALLALAPWETTTKLRHHPNIPSIPISQYLNTQQKVF